MSRIIFLLSLLLLFFTPGAAAQARTRASVSCGEIGETHANCSYRDGNVHDTASANVSYGSAEIATSIEGYCSTYHCAVETGLQAVSFFKDEAIIENAPNAGAYFMIGVQLSGTSSRSNGDLSTPISLQLNINDNEAECTVRGSSGYCHARLPVAISGSYDFSVNLIGSTLVKGIFGSGIGISGSCDFAGKITKLAVVDENGQVINAVTITTASGHTYPL